MGDARSFVPRNADSQADLRRTHVVWQDRGSRRLAWSKNRLFYAESKVFFVIMMRTGRVHRLLT